MTVNGALKGVLTEIQPGILLLPYLNVILDAYATVAVIEIGVPKFAVVAEPKSEKLLKELTCSIYVKAPTAVEESIELVTETLFAPKTPAGVVTVIDVEVFDLREVADTPPILTDVMLDKFVPEIVNVSPPAINPVLGVTVLITGGAK